MLRDVRITQDETAIAAVVLKHHKGMKESWCKGPTALTLGHGRSSGGTRAASRRRISAAPTGAIAEVVVLDVAEPLLDRELFISAIAPGLLTQLGAAGEACGLDRILKSNTLKTRTSSLFDKGSYWYRAIPNVGEERLRPLMEAFARIVADHAALEGICGVI